MLMQEPDPTPFDLRWRMFGVPVRIHPLFWVLAAFLGWQWFEAAGIGYLTLWMACVAGSIILHELGHVLTGRWFGAEGHILLYWDGGLAIGSNDLPARWQRVAVLLAGPGTQLVLYALLLAVKRPLLNGAPSEPMASALEMLLLINLYWPILNLLPLWPLDGGQISRELLSAAMPGRGGVIALYLSIALSGGLAVLVLLSAKGMIRPLPYIGGSIYMALLFAMFCMSSYQALQFERVRSRGWDDRFPWER